MKTKVIVESQVNIFVQPVNAEAYDFPFHIGVECNTLANKTGKTVVLLDRDGNRSEYWPNKHW